MCKSAFIQPFLGAHCKPKGRCRPSVKRQLYEASRQGNTLESSVGSGKKEKKFRPININLMTDGNTAQLSKFHFHPQLQVQMKTSCYLAHISSTEPSEMHLVNQYLFTSYLFFISSLLSIHTQCILCWRHWIMSSVKEERQVQSQDLSSRRKSALLSVNGISHFYYSVDSQIINEMRGQPSFLGLLLESK